MTREEAVLREKAPRQKCRCVYDRLDSCILTGPRWSALQSVYFFRNGKNSMMQLLLGNETFPHKLMVLYYCKMCNMNHVRH